MDEAQQWFCACWSEWQPLASGQRGICCLYVCQSQSSVMLGECVLICESIRKALQSLRGRSSGGGWSSTLSGHSSGGMRRDQHRHLHCLVVPARGRPIVQSLLLWAPEGLAAVDLDCARRLHRVLGRRHPALALECPTPRLAADVRRRVFGPSRVWQSLTPMALARFPRRRGGRMVDTEVEQVARELAVRSSVLAERLESVRRLRPAGCLGFVQHRASEQRPVDRLVMRLELTFSEPVHGPIVLGYNCHFGLGLFEACELG